MKILDSTALNIINSWTWGNIKPESVLFLPQKTIRYEGERFQGMYLTRAIKNRDEYKIKYVSTGSTIDVNSILVHELRHVWQDSHKRLYGPHSPDSAREFSYEELPTELDANLWENIYKFRKTLEDDYMIKIEELKSHEILI